VNCQHLLLFKPIELHTKLQFNFLLKQTKPWRPINAHEIIIKHIQHTTEKIQKPTVHKNKFA